MCSFVFSQIRTTLPVDIRKCIRKWTLEFQYGSMLFDLTFRAQFISSWDSCVLALKRGTSCGTWNCFFNMEYFFIFLLFSVFLFPKFRSEKSNSLKYYEESVNALVSKRLSGMNLNMYNSDKQRLILRRFFKLIFRYEILWIDSITHRVFFGKIFASNFRQCEKRDDLGWKRACRSLLSVSS